MVYFPVIVLCAMALLVAGWRKGLVIILDSVLICLTFGWFHFVDLRPLPANLWHAFLAIAGFPLYLYRNPGDWLPILTPIGVVVALLAVLVGFATLLARTKLSRRRPRRIRERRSPHLCWSERKIRQWRGRPVALEPSV